MCLLMLFVIPKIHFHQLGPFKLKKNNVETLKCFVSVESLSKG